MKYFLTLIVLSCFGKAIWAQSTTCAGATSLPVNTSCTYTTFDNTENGQPAAGSNPAPSCMTGTQYQDVWYTVTGTGSNIQITVNAPDRAMTLAVWSSCAATTQLACMTVANGGNNTTSFPTTLGTTYYIQIIRTGGNSNADLSGSICAISNPPAPANDNCANATVITQSATCTPTSGTVSGATNSGIVTGCTGTADDDVWYQFTATSSIAVINRTTTGGWDSGVEIFASTGAAPGSCIGPSIACKDPESNMVVSGLTVGMNYYVRVYYWYTGSTSPGNFTICVTTPNTTNISACSGTFYDSGGNGGSYANDEVRITTICPSVAGNKAKVSFTAFNTESGVDYIQVFDGNSTSAPSLGIYSGTSLPGTFQASSANASGCLTFLFMSDGFGTASGWAATISCVVPCQTITSNLTSTNEAAGAGGIIRICQGQSVNFVGSGTFSNSASGATYTWNMGNGATVNGTNINYTWPAVGSYLVNLIITDPNGCKNSNSINQQVQVSTTPSISTSANPATLCTNQTSALSANVSMTNYTVNCTPPVSGTTFLPDGDGVSYETSITTNCYAPGSTVTAASDITNVCLNMEHSYMGDLGIELICPNGQSMILKAYSQTTNSGYYLGHPIDVETDLTAGTGETYCFTPGATTYLVNGSTTSVTTPSPGTMVNPGNYMPFQSFTNLIGCPLNGNWTIRVTDNISYDNGYIFNWDVNFSAALLTASSFTPTIVSQGWVPQTTLTSTGATTANVTPTNQGTPCFTYSVTDNFGCTYTAPQCLTVNCGASLPIGLVYFDANAVNNNTVRLNWETSSEQDNDYFVVERSANGEEPWLEVATVDGAGDSETPIDYSTNDNSPLSGVSYYRLKQTDFNGSTRVHDVQSVYIDESQFKELIIYPNPATELVTVKGDLVSLSTFQLLNAMGQNIRSQLVSYTQADGTLVLDLSSLRSGVYLVKNGSKVYSLVKQ